MEVLAICSFGGRKKRPVGSSAEAHPLPLQNAVTSNIMPVFPAEPMRDLADLDAGQLGVQDARWQNDVCWGLHPDGLRWGPQSVTGVMSGVSKKIPT